MQFIAEAAIAEARSVRDEVASQMAEVTKRSDVSMSNIADALTGKVQQVAAHFEAQTLQAIGQVAEQLEREVKVVATSTAGQQKKRHTLLWRTFAVSHRHSLIKFT